ncbi:hypothetical protein NBRC3257_3224 [Gluconobacter thailandicus NBRC 3257]|uniref:Transposase n=1 Tax=Gluconobacter thailandicus NBRC 3257 TaxID=1381097 RepID=A0ABQ0J185_GLUTH|nr:hypothetical protein B932_2967 [Gluconobacter oxydans H24]GAC89273.1 hypothetical protein NBRC3255_2934 [Gluconobacter thailandicus NBRC 3255]GAD28225.1 hypothetical protein NBRC3257_3224 [Gluconobacter thailandicus NBRC 3257]
MFLAKYGAYLEHRQAALAPDMSELPSREALEYTVSCDFGECH